MICLYFFEILLIFLRDEVSAAKTGIERPSRLNRREGRFYKCKISAVNHSVVI